MEDKKQSSIDYIGQELFKHKIAFENEFVILDILEKAKEIHKQEIMDGWLSAWKDSFLEPLEDRFYIPEAEQYYYETYNTTQ